jgi:hypothetical protein
MKKKDAIKNDIYHNKYLYQEYLDKSERLQKKISINVDIFLQYLVDEKKQSWRTLGCRSESKSILSYLGTFETSYSSLNQPRKVMLP